MRVHSDLVQRLARLEAHRENDRDRGPILDTMQDRLHLTEIHLTEVRDDIDTLKKETSKLSDLDTHIKRMAARSDLIKSAFQWFTGMAVLAAAVAGKLPVETAMKFLSKGQN